MSATAESDKDPFESLRVWSIIANALAILVCCYMILSLLVRPSRKLASAIRMQNNMAAKPARRSQVNRRQGRTSQIDHTEYSHCFQSCIKCYKGLVQFVKYCLSRLEFRHLNAQKWLRLGASLCLLISNVARLFTSIYFWSREMWDSPIESKFGSLFYSIFLWMAVALYTTALLDRFERIEMIVPKTTSYYVVQTCKFLFIVSGLAIVVLESYSKTKWILLETAGLDLLNGASAILAGVLGLSSILLELSLNIRLMHTSLKLHIDTYSGNEPRGHSRRYKRLRNKMITMYCALLFFDAGMLFSFSIARVTAKAPDTLFLLMTLSTALHLFVSFKLLDIFLRELKQAQATPTTMVATQKNTNDLIDSKTDVASKGLIPCSFEFSAPTVRKEYSSFFNSQTQGESSLIQIGYPANIPLSNMGCKSLSV